MKKLLIFSLLSIAIPAAAMQNVPTEHTPGLYINPIVNRFKGNDAPAGSAVIHIVHDDKPEIIDYPTLPVHLGSHVQDIDSNGRTLIWWVALMGKKNLYDNLVRSGANPNIKSTKGLLAGFSAAQLIEMNPEEINAIIDSGAHKAKP